MCERARLDRASAVDVGALERSVRSMLCAQLVEQLLQIRARQRADPFTLCALGATVAQQHLAEELTRLSRARQPPLRFHSRWRLQDAIHQQGAEVVACRDIDPVVARARHKT
eukprot:6629325-Prymnesium_polylepis.2